MKRFWVPGWQCNGQEFAGVFAYLGQPEPVCHYADASIDAAHWLKETAAQLHDAETLVGWSLGGMLALHLALLCPSVQRVSLIACNTQFRGGPGLPEHIADDFMARYQHSAEATRKRFARLVDAQQPKQVSGLLLDSDQQHTLHWLYQLTAPAELPTHLQVRVLLAEQDQLVPVHSAAQAWRGLGANVTTMAGQHSLPFTESEQVARWLHG